MVRPLPTLSVTSYEIPLPTPRPNPFVFTLFYFPYDLTPAFAILTKTPGVAPNNSHYGTDFTSTLSHIKVSRTTSFLSSRTTGHGSFPITPLPSALTQNTPITPAKSALANSLNL